MLCFICLECSFADVFQPKKSGKETAKETDKKQVPPPEKVERE